MRGCRNRKKESVEGGGSDTASSISKEGGQILLRKLDISTPVEASKLALAQGWVSSGWVNGVRSEGAGFIPLVRPFQIRDEAKKDLVSTLTTQ
jgi:hypothetical protein